MARPNQARREDAADPIELLAACHERIRRFAGLAQKLAAAKGAPEHEVRDVAAAVRRYFDEALPLHVADEEESVLPRLRARAAAATGGLAALERIVDEHRDHQHDLAMLVLLCGELAEDPRQLDERRMELEELAKRLADDFERHLAFEERELFPAIERLLPLEERRALAAEFRARRAERDADGVHAR